MSTHTTDSRSAAHDDEEDYAALLKRLHGAIQGLPAETPLFTTQAHSALFDLFLTALPEGLRQAYNCAICRRFVSRYGGLVTLDDKGRSTPLLWSADARGVLAEAERAVYEAVRSAPVHGVFKSGASQLGLPVAGGWPHMSVALPDGHAAHHPPGSVLSASQRQAVLQQDYAMLRTALAEFTPHQATLAQALLEDDSFKRASHILPQARWFLGLHERTRARKGAGLDNTLWHAVATAPAGWAHVRSGMLGTLLHDIAAGKSVGQIAAAFNRKMDPLAYRRPQNRPSPGQVAAAEKIVATLKTQGALARRFARPDDVRRWLWRPAPQPEPSGGVFSTVLTRATGAAAQALRQEHLGRQAMTWSRFQAEVLAGPPAQIEAWLPESGPYYAFVTAQDPQAPLMVQWDNPVTWYTYPQGSPAARWALEPGWCTLDGICSFPHQWEAPERHTRHGKGVLLVAEGARPQEQGAGFFPEFLRSDYHPIRHTLEQYVRQTPPSGTKEPAVCGLALRQGSKHAITLRVTGRTGLVKEYTLDRWS